jgi:activator of Hsp90 ATPase-like protein
VPGRYSVVRHEADEYRCRDELRIAASRERCFEVLVDLSTHARWWTLVRVTPEGTPSSLSTGTRVRFSGAHPGGERVEWSAEVLEVRVPVRIELAYALRGLSRLLGGPGAELDDETWRRDVRRRVADGIRALEPGVHRAG